MTKLKLNAMDAFALGIVSVGALATAAVYSRLPARIPTHFDLHGRVDGWMDRSKGAWLLPICALAIWALVRFAVQVVPVVHRASAAKPMRAVALLTAGLMTGLQILVLRAALFPAGSIAGSLTFMLGVFMISMAQLLPRTQRNAFVGIRTPWALASDESWARTHRLAGYAFTVAGSSRSWRRSWRGQNPRSSHSRH